MTREEAEIIHALIPFADVEDIIHTHEFVWTMTNQHLLDDYRRLQASIPKMPLLAELKGKTPVIRNLRDDLQYIQWERKHGLLFEVLEFEVNRRNIYPRTVRRIEVMK